MNLKKSAYTLHRPAESGLPNVLIHCALAASAVMSVALLFSSMAKLSVEADQVAAVRKAGAPLVAGASRKKTPSGTNAAVPPRPAPVRGPATPG